jgi:glycosyltransferase 2 family protein
MVAGLIAFFIYIYFFIGFNQITVVLSSLNSAQFAFFYVFSLLAVLAEVFFWSTSWNVIMRVLSLKLSYRRAYLYQWAGYFVDLVLPCATVCGEVTRMYLVHRYTKQDYGPIAASAIANRIVAYAIVTVGLYGGALLFLEKAVPAAIFNIFIIFLVGTTAYLAALLYLAFVKSAARNITRLYLWLKKVFGKKGYNPVSVEKTESSLSKFYDGFQMFRQNPRLLVKPFIFQLVSYMLGLLSYVLIFYALDTPLVYPEFYIVIYFLSSAIQDVLASVSVGILDIILATLFVLYGLNPALSGILAVVIRSATFWFPLLVGLISVEIVGARDLITPQRLSETRKKQGSA